MQFDLGAEIVAMLPRLRRFALGLCRNGEEADDLVQGACERALVAAASFTPGTRLDSWLFRIIRNLWLDRLRRTRSHGEELSVDDIVEYADARTENVAEWRLLLGDVWPALGALPPEQREVLLLVCVEELSYREAAEVMGVPVGTIMSRLARARRKLAEGLGMAGGMNGEDGRSPETKG